jgi:hypothetical protein
MPAKRLSAWTRLAVLMALMVALPCCIKPQHHRPENIELADGFAVAYIEFDDQGEPWDPSQLERTIQKIERANREYERIGVALFVHGWQNDASNPEDRKNENNVEGFKRLLDVTQKHLEHTGEIDAGTKLIGVYVGWRGKSSRNKWIKPLTFYSRRGAGKRVAGVSTTEAIIRVMNAAKRNPESVAIVIGHSFGGMIVEQALSQSMISLAIDESSTIDPPADLIILVNPASQSIEAKRMLSILERNRLKFYRTDKNGERRESPLIVSVTSTADTATGNLYPAAMGVKAMTKRFREYGPGDCSPGATQKAYYRHTAGHNQILHSHVITAEPLPSQTETADLLGYEESVNEDTGDVNYSFMGRDHRFVMKRLPYSYNDTPYWIMNVADDPGAGPPQRRVRRRGPQRSGPRKRRPSGVDLSATRGRHRLSRALSSVFRCAPRRPAAASAVLPARHRRPRLDCRRHVRGDRGVPDHERHGDGKEEAENPHRRGHVRLRATRDNRLHAH